MNKQRVLFVDDEKNILNGLRRMLHGMRSEWDMHFAEGGQEALERLAESHYDVIVSDMRMPGISGGELLTRVREQYPDTIRIALSGYADSEMILENLQAIHVFLSKPTNQETLQSAIERALSLHRLVKNEKLVKLMSQVGSLPALPELYQKISAEVASENGSIAKVGELISQDVSMSAKLLQLVNSAFFGLARTINSPTEAAVYLGVDVIKSLVLSVKIFESFPVSSGYLGEVQKLWRESQLTSALAGRFAKQEGLSEAECKVAVTAGMLKNIGILILLTHFAEEYQEIKVLVSHDQMNFSEAQRQVLQCTHWEIGAYLLGLWGLPDALMEAVICHSCSGFFAGQDFNANIAVLVAEELLHKQTRGGQISDDLLALDCVTEEKLQVWEEITTHLLSEN